MTSLEWLLVAFAVVFAINVVPAFMPATWMVVAFFLIAYHLPFWPLCLGSAVAATAGRCLLALISSRWGRTLLSAQQQQNVAALGDWLNTKSGWRQALAVLVYASGPIPSNQLFIAAGLVGARLGPIAAGFFAGRLISYPVFASSAKGVSDHFGTIFLKEWKDPRFVLLELLSLAGVVLFAHIDWPRLLHLPVPSVRGSSPAAQHTSSPAAQHTASAPQASPAAIHQRKEPSGSASALSCSRSAPWSRSPQRRAGPAATIRRGGLTREPLRPTRRAVAAGPRGTGPGASGPSRDRAAGSGGRRWGRA